MCCDAVRLCRLQAFGAQRVGGWIVTVIGSVGHGVKARGVCAAGWPWSTLFCVPSDVMVL